MAVSDTKLADAENPAATKFGDDSDVDFAGRANWLRAAVLGANDADVELAQLDRDGKRGGDEERALPSPIQAAVASALAFSVGALLPLLAAGFIVGYRLRVAVVVAVATMALAVFGYVGAVLGRAPVARSCARVVVGGLAAMGVTFGLMRLFRELAE
ncbi:hypothetical protein ACQ4PT_062942 [Festuca glaucescens]